jgi:hypothetical protein
MIWIDANDIVDGKKHLAKAEDMFNMIQNGTEVAEAVFEKNGVFKVKDVTPADFAKGEWGWCFPIVFYGDRGGVLSLPRQLWNGVGDMTKNVMPSLV